MLTWILVALRAATEPVKEEAMQAILSLSVWCVFKERVRVWRWDRDRGTTSPRI